jgi:hypothetical protein
MTLTSATNFNIRRPDTIREKPAPRGLFQILVSRITGQVESQYFKFPISALIVQVDYFRVARNPSSIDADIEITSYKPTSQY